MLPPEFTMRSPDYPAAHNPEISIRHAASHDLEPLTQILTESFYGEMAQTPISSWLYAFLHWSIRFDLQTRFAEANANSCCLVAATNNGQAIATTEIHFRYISLAPWYILTFPQKSAYLSNLAVRSDCRRQGLASQLLQAAEQIASDRGFKEIYLHVMADNQGARNFYAKLNYHHYKQEFSLDSWLWHRPARLLLQKKLH